MNKNLMPWKRRQRALQRREDDPFEALHRQMDDLFEDFLGGLALPAARGTGWGRGLAAPAPSFEVSETDEAVEVTAELPGMDEKDIEVSLDENVLTVRGEKKEEREEKKRNTYFSERTYGSFERVLPLPADIVQEKAKARFKKGVLTISLPKAEPSKTEKRAINIEVD